MAALGDILTWYIQTKQSHWTQWGNWMKGELCIRGIMQREGIGQMRGIRQMGSCATRELHNRGIGQQGNIWESEKMGK